MSSFLKLNKPMQFQSMTFITTKDKMVKKVVIDTWIKFSHDGRRIEIKRGGIFDNFKFCYEFSTTAAARIISGIL